MPTRHHARDQMQHHTPYQTEHYTRTKAKKVLVIEDDKVSLLMLTLIIKGAGYRVVGAPDGAQALKAIRLERPDLILADINLTSEATGSEWDGFQVLEWMNHHYPEHRTKCVIVSGGPPDQVRQRAASLGAFGYVPKPIVKNLLLAEVRRAIGIPPESQTRIIQRPPHGLA